MILPNSTGAKKFTAPSTTTLLDTAFLPVALAETQGA
jgi:hypothetical protein